MRRLTATLILLALTLTAWPGTGQAPFLTLRCLPGKGSLPLATSVAFSPDGRYLAAGAANNTAVVWDAATWRQLAVLHLATPQPDDDMAHVAVCFSADGSTLAAATNRYFQRPPQPPYAEVRLWHTRDWKLWQTLTAAVDSNHGLCRLAYGPTGHDMAASGGLILVRWDIASKATVEQPLAPYLVQTDSNHDCIGDVTAVGFSANARWLGAIVTSGTVGEVQAGGGIGRSALVLWDAASYQKAQVIEGVDGSFAFSPDSRSLAAVGTYEPVQVYATDTLQRTGRFGDHLLQPLRFTTNQQLAVCRKAEVVLFDLHGKLQGTLKPPPSADFSEVQDGYFTDLSPSPRGMLAATTVDGLVALWRL